MRCRLLIVDDFRPFAEAVRDLLRAAGIEVVGIAEDGAQALRLAAETGPDVALVDIGLPDLDGFQVARRLRSAAAGPEVVLTSSRDWSDLGGRVAVSGACGFLDKEQLDADAIMGLLGHPWDRGRADG